MYKGGVSGLEGYGKNDTGNGDKEELLCNIDMTCMGTHTHIFQVASAMETMIKLRLINT